MSGIVIAAGGTGGHLYPAIAVAQELVELSPGIDPLFVGGARALEAAILARAGFRRAAVSSSPWRRNRPWTLSLALLNILRGFFQAGRLLEREKARVVFATGGYATIPTLLAAWIKRIPAVLHEPDSVPGAANRLFGRLAARVVLGSEEGAAKFPAGRTVYTGVPVRKELLRAERAGAREKLGIGQDRLVILVLGGSQGARALNRAVAAALPDLAAADDKLALIWLCGEKDLDELKPAASAAGLPVRLLGYLDDMGAALKAADIALARAGASTLAEILACGLPSILVPYPHATADHQLRNAAALVRGGAAEILEERDLTPSLLAGRLLELSHNANLRGRMAGAAMRLAHPDAGRRIAAEIMGFMREEGEC